MSGAVDSPLVKSITTIPDAIGDWAMNVVGKDTSAGKVLAKQGAVGDSRKHKTALKNLTESDSFGNAIGGAIRPYVEDMKGTYGEVLGGIKGPAEPLPNVAVEDPNARAEADKKERARARRQQEVDILTGQPGRGGTVANSSYGYRV